MYNNPNDILYSARSRTPSQSQSFGVQNFYDDDMLYLNEQDNFNIPKNSTPSSYQNNHTAKSQEKGDLFNSQIKFKPKFFDFDLAQKKYKGVQAIISTKSQLPQLSITSSLQKKIQKNLTQANKKDSYIFITKQTTDITQDRKFILDEISYSTEEAMEENYYELNKYPILLVTSTLPEVQSNEFENAIDLEKELMLMNNLCKNCRGGSFSLFSIESPFHRKNTDFSMTSQDSDSSQTDTKTINSSDLIYLNMFRIFTFLIKSKNSSTAKYIAHRVLYFPNVSFKLSSIQQPFKLVSTPLATLVTKKQKCDINEPKQSKKAHIKFGFISLDANQRMLLFATSDPLASQIPLIGLWIYGINPQIELLNDDDPEKRVLQGILFEYINSTLGNRYSFDKTKKTFLLAMFSPDDGAKYYETEFIESHDNQEIENRWLMLKVSRDTSNINDAIDYLQWSFMLSPDNIIKDLSSLKKHIVESAQNLSKDSQYSTKRIKNNNDSLSNYLNTNIKENFSDNGDDEIDNYDLNYKLPKPQPQPQLQPQQLNHRLDESKDSQRTGAFLHGNEQTFDQESRYKNLLSDSIKKNPHQSSQWDSNFSQGFGSNSPYEKLSPFAEQLLNQQSQQLKFLQDQILTLQTALLNYQTNTSQSGYSKLSINTNSSPSDVKPPDTGKFGTTKNISVFPNVPETKSTRDFGTDPIEFDPPKKFETKSTNTSFSISKDEQSTGTLSKTDSIAPKESFYNENKGANIIENFFETNTSEKNNEEKFEYNPSTYLDKFSSKSFARYDDTYQEKAYERLVEKPKISQDPIKDKFFNENREEKEPRIFKDITNDFNNNQQENEFTWYRSMNKAFAEDLSYEQKFHNQNPSETQINSDLYVSLKENTGVPSLLEAHALISKKIEEAPLSERIENQMKLSQKSEEEQKHSRMQSISSNILGPIEGQETSIKISRMRFQKKMLDSDSEDEEIKKLTQKYLTKKVY